MALGALGEGGPRRPVKRKRCCLLFNPLKSSSKQSFLLLSFRFSDRNLTEFRTLVIAVSEGLFAMFPSTSCVRPHLKIILPGLWALGQLMALASAQNSPNSAALSASRTLPAQVLKLPMQFEPNAGQTDSQVQFLSRGPG